jgi:hypothetical protein
MPAIVRVRRVDVKEHAYTLFRDGNYTLFGIRDDLRKMNVDISVDAIHEIIVERLKTVADSSAGDQKKLISKLTESLGVGFVDTNQPYMLFLSEMIQKLNQRTKVIIDGLDMSAYGVSSAKALIGLVKTMDLLKEKYDQIAGQMGKLNEQFHSHLDAYHYQMCETFVNAVKQTVGDDNVRAQLLQAVMGNVKKVYDEYKTKTIIDSPSLSEEV